jgi:hypothetical protein
METLVGWSVKAAPFFIAIPMAIFGVQHFIYLRFVADFIPAWIPWRTFWACFTGFALFAAAVGIAFKIWDRWAATLLGTMSFLWGLLLHTSRIAHIPDDFENGAAFSPLMSGCALPGPECGAKTTSRGNTTKGSGPIIDYCFRTWSQARPIFHRRLDGSARTGTLRLCESHGSSSARVDSGNGGWKLFERHGFDCGGCWDLFPADRTTGIHAVGNNYVPIDALRSRSRCFQQPSIRVRLDQDVGAVGRSLSSGQTGQAMKTQATGESVKSNTPTARSKRT